VAGELPAPADEGQVGCHSSYWSSAPNQQAESEWVASVERHAQDFVVVDHLSQRRRGRVNEGRCAGDFDSLTYRPYLQFDGQVGGLVDLKRDTGEHFGLVARGSYGHGVGAEGHELRIELTLVVGVSCTYLAGSEMGDRYGGAGENTASVVLDDSDNGSGGNLCPREA